MPIAYGLIDFCKVPQKDRFHALAQEEEGRDEEEGTSSASQHASAVARGDGDVARGDGGGESALHLEESCLLCNSQDKNVSSLGGNWNSIRAPIIFMTLYLIFR